MLKRLGFCFLIAGICFLSAETRILSIRSEELSSTSNKIYITVSDSIRYSVQKLTEAKGVRVILYDVEGNVKPSYPRLSAVLDRITCYPAGNNLVVDIITMGDYPVNSYFESGENLLTLTIHSSGAGKAMSSKVLRKAEQTLKSEAVSQTVNKEKIKTSSGNTNDEFGLSSNKIEDIPSQEAVADSLKLSSSDTISIPVEEVGNEPNCNLPSFWNRYKYLILSIIAVVCLFFVLKSLFKKKRKRLGNEDKSGEESALLLPPETAKLMVQKLLDKDWKPEEIARELHLSVKEVNKIIAALKKESDE